MTPLQIALNSATLALSLAAIGFTIGNRASDPQRQAFERDAQALEAAQARADANLDAFLQEVPNEYWWSPELNKFMAQKVYPAMNSARRAGNPTEALALLEGVDLERARQLQYCKPTPVVRTTDPGGMVYMIELRLARPKASAAKAAQYCQPLPADARVVTFES